MVKRTIFLLNLFFITMFLMLLNVKAITQISSVSIKGQDTVNVGDIFYEEFHINFSNFEQTSPDTLGIWMVAYEIDYNDNDFIIDDILSNGNIWESAIIKEDGKTYVISEFSNNSSSNTCIGNQLYCGEYVVNIKITAKDTNNQTSKIIIKQIEAAAFKVYEDQDYEYSLDDAVELSYNLDAVKVLNIKKNTNVKESEKTAVNNLSNSNPIIQDSSLDTNNQTTVANNNVNLKSLEIENYTIDFKPDVKTYDININKNINTLNVLAVADNDSAIIEVIGADNLKDNNNKVVINIFLENELKNTYTIYTNISNQKTKQKNKNLFKIDKKTGLFIIIGGIIIVIIIIVVIVLNIISNKKIDKGLDF